MPTFCFGDQRLRKKPEQQSLHPSLPIGNALLTASFQCPPVLLVAFNRPDLTQKVFGRIRDARPTQLFFAVDGPRADRPGEAESCAQSRAIAGHVDWPCEVHTLFRSHNLGCKHAVSSAITWFFEHVEEGIILEDDCLPDPSFFRFCTELLERYRNEGRVMVISGNNFQRGRTDQYPSSYYFSAFNHIWGWASWRRAWAHYDLDMNGWAASENRKAIRRFLGNDRVFDYWSRHFAETSCGRIDTWDYQWTYCCWAQRGLSVLPKVNLVSNIGFDARATHTHDPESRAANLPAQEMSFPLRHPSRIQRDRRSDQYTSIQLFGISSQPQIQITRTMRRVAARLKRRLLYFLQG